METKTTKETPVLVDRANDISAFASEDQTRHVLNGIFVNGKYTEATDGRIAIRVPFVKTPTDEFPVTANVTTEREQVIVPTKAFKEAVAKAAGHKSIIPSVNCVRVSTRKQGTSTRAQLAVNDLDSERVTEVKVVDGNYPQTEQIYPKDEPKLTIALCAHYLKMIAEYAIKHGNCSGNSSTIPVKLEFIDELSAVRFSVKLADKERTAEGVLMPVRLV